MGRKKKRKKEREEERERRIIRFDRVLRNWSKYYQTRLIVLDAISEIKFNLMESSIKLTIFFSYLQEPGKTFLSSSVRHSHSSFFLLHPLLPFLHFFAPLEKACIRKTIPPFDFVSFVINLTRRNR